MTHLFDDSVLGGVLGHMNGDHGDDNVLIARAFATEEDATPDDIIAARMVGFDGDEGRWEATLASGATLPVAVRWLNGPISERPQVRREIVALYDEACRRLGVPPRPHA